MQLPKITDEFLADVERLSTKTIEENKHHEAKTMKAGTMLILVTPENQLAVVKHIRLLRRLLNSALGELEDTGGTFAADIAASIRAQLAAEVGA